MFSCDSQIQSCALSHTRNLIKPAGARGGPQAARFVYVNWNVIGSPDRSCVRSSRASRKFTASLSSWTILTNAGFSRASYPVTTSAQTIEVNNTQDDSVSRKAPLVEPLLTRMRKCPR